MNSLKKLKKDSQEPGETGMHWAGTVSSTGATKIKTNKTASNTTETPRDVRPCLTLSGLA